MAEHEERQNPKGSTSLDLGYLCYHGHFCFYADPDERGECGSKRVGTVTLTFDFEAFDEDWSGSDIVAAAQASLAEKYETWRTCECDELRKKVGMQRDGVTTWEAVVCPTCGANNGEHGMVDGDFCPNRSAEVGQAELRSRIAGALLTLHAWEASLGIAPLPEHRGITARIKELRVMLEGAS